MIVKIGAKKPFSLIVLLKKFNRKHQGMRVQPDERGTDKQ